MLAEAERERVGYPDRAGDHASFPVLVAGHNRSVLQLYALLLRHAHLEWVEDDDDAPNLDDDGRIGVIHVSVMRISRKDRVKHSAPSHRKPEFRSVGVVHERSKKAGAHCVSCVFAGVV